MKPLDIADPYANFVYVSDFGLHMNAGVRLNNHNAYGSHFIYNLNPSFTLQIRIRDIQSFSGLTVLLISRLPYLICMEILEQTLT